MENNYIIEQIEKNGKIVANLKNILVEYRYNDIEENEIQRIESELEYYSQLLEGYYHMLKSYQLEEEEEDYASEIEYYDIKFCKEYGIYE